MKRVGGLLLAVVLVGWILAEVPVARTEPAATTVAWRRTVNGWESAAAWSHGPQTRPIRLHPAVVGAFELLVSVGALMAFSTPKAVAPRQ